MMSRYSQRLLQFGFLLFLLGLLTGLGMPFFANPRMGLSSHLQGVVNGIFLVGLGLVWPRLRLSLLMQGLTFWTALYGTAANWAATLCAAIWGAGSSMMPIAGQGLQGNPWQEFLIAGLLLSLSGAMILVCGIVLWGLRSQTTEPEASPSVTKGAIAAAVPRVD